MRAGGWTRHRGVVFVSYGVVTAPNTKIDWILRPAGVLLNSGEELQKIVNERQLWQYRFLFTGKAEPLTLPLNEADHATLPSSAVDPGPGETSPSPSKTKEIIKIEDTEFMF
jgi:hypothetical protein